MSGILLSIENEALKRINCWVNLVAHLVKTYFTGYQKGLDIGCDVGLFMDNLRNELNIEILGIDPNQDIVNEGKSRYWGYCHEIPFGDASFDFVTLISVAEHIQPELRKKSVIEIQRVLKPGGLLFIQMPNPRFPIEVHTRLPLAGFLPRTVLCQYTRILRKKDVSFWTIDLREFLNYICPDDFSILFIKDYVYPKEVLPKEVQRFHSITRVFPMGSFALLRRRDE